MSLYHILKKKAPTEHIGEQLKRENQRPHLSSNNYRSTPVSHYTHRMWRAADVSGVVDGI